MIPKGAAIRDKLINDLVDLRGTPAQIMSIGNILFAATAADSSRDTEYLLECIQASDDPLIKQACRVIMDCIVGAKS